ncbi:MAG: hypothetical protein K0S07_7 [Chlamydiales bacterium]|jgi:uncharacterized protein (TIGR00251 family)|nr:hypothetical protein [Chlamydiales bacterium]
MRNNICGRALEQKTWGAKKKGQRKKESMKKPLILLVKVIPQARRTEIVSFRDGLLKMRLHATPEKGKANAALIAFLASLFSLPKNALTILQGHTAPLKRLSIAGDLSEASMEKLILSALSQKP